MKIFLVILKVIFAPIYFPFKYRKDITAYAQKDKGYDLTGQTGAGGRLVYDPGHPQANLTWQGSPGYRKASSLKAIFASLCLFGGGYLYFIGYGYALQIVDGNIGNSPSVDSNSTYPQ
jgi:hypothetical protein